MKLAFIATLLLGSVATASAQQTTTFTGPMGQYQGQARTYGNTTTFTGPMGQYQGQARTYGGTTTYTGPMGQYQGQSRTVGNGLFGFGR
jgi:hypothetical protein